MAEKSYAFNLMEVQKFHDLGYKGQGVKVAVMDTGVQQHEDLTIEGGINAYDSDKPYDTNLNRSHGTMVAGVIASQQTGIAPECELYVIRVDDGTSTPTGDLWDAHVKGIEWAIDNEIDIINCSFSGIGDSLKRRNAFKKAHDAGIAIFCSAGNRQSGINLNMSQMTYPGIYPFVVTTANIKKNKGRYGSSCTGYGLNFASGGVNIESTTTDNKREKSKDYRTGTGTSYANPAVASMYALYKNMFPYASRERLLQLMFVNAERLGDGFLYGAGLPKFPNTSYEKIQIHARERD